MTVPNPIIDSSPLSLRYKIFLLLSPKPNSLHSQRFLDYFFQGLIFINFIIFIWGTVPSAKESHIQFFTLFANFSYSVFFIEYLLRMWCCVEHHKHQDTWKGRLSWILSPLALIDAAVLISGFLALPGVDLRFLRCFRCFRLMRYFRIRKYWEAMLLLKQTYLHARDTLVTAFIVFATLMTTFAIGMYFAERHEQEAFESVPRAMWWSCVTMTTVGYGDVTPVTNTGRLIAAIAALTGVAMLGVPAGVIAAGLVEEWEKLKTLEKLGRHKERVSLFLD